MPERSRPVTFLLSQLGTLASTRFADALHERHLTPGQAGVIRLLARNPGISQRELSQRLGTVPSRVVALIDELEKRDLVQRTRSTVDRRSQELALTARGEAELAAIRPLAEANERAFTAGLDSEERADLSRLLTKLAEAHSLDPDVHPGYRPARRTGDDGD
jgi:DNA-binding MarR family transcriptional regulator